jgi:hypothetical protein
MNTSYSSKLTAAGFGLLFSALLSTAAFAGPGPQYWAALGKATATNASAKAVTPCADAQVIPVTLARPALANGKGPLVETQVGTRTVCHICPVKSFTVRNAQANGRGPVTVTETTQTGVEHDCANCTGTPAKS